MRKIIVIDELTQIYILRLNETKPFPPNVLLSLKFRKCISDSAQVLRLIFARNVKRY